jgi:hypothetical protein
LVPFDLNDRTQERFQTTKEKTMNPFTFTRKAVLFVLLALCAGLASAQNLPPTAVYARAYNGWNIVGQQANTYTFNGGVCNYAPYNNGQTPSFFVFGGFQASTYVYFPTAIIDADPTKSEIVTPTSTTSTSASCGFSASTANAHTSFNLISGTGGLQEAIVTQQQSAPTFDVLLDKVWYAAIAALPGPPNPQAVIASAKGNANVGIVDTTTLPWTYFCYNGTNYTACASNQTVPTLTSEGQGAGGTPTGLSIVGNGVSGVVNLTTGGTAPTTAATIFLITWPTVALGGFQYAPVCTVSSVGANIAPQGTVSTSAGPPATMTYTSNATTALTNTTAYKFAYTCR